MCGTPSLISENLVLSGASLNCQCAYIEALAVPIALRMLSPSARAPGQSVVCPDVSVIQNGLLYGAVSSAKDPQCPLSPCPAIAPLNWRVSGSSMIALRYHSLRLVGVRCSGTRILVVTPSEWDFHIVARW